MNLITEIEGVPLDGSDLRSMATKLGNNAVKSLLYDNLAGVTLDELFSDVNTVFILYQIRNGMGPKPVVGHWVSLIKNDMGFQYYDPYGLTISQDLHITGEPDHFKRLFKGKTVNINDKRHQRFKNEVNTCGRHCVSRSTMWFLNNGEYNDLLQPIVQAHMVSTLDVYVSILTMFLDDSDKAVLQMIPQLVTR